jgi:hypothetical protein
MSSQACSLSFYCVASLEGLPVAVLAESYNGEHWWVVTCRLAIRQVLTEIWDGLRGRIPFGGFPEACSESHHAIHATTQITTITNITKPKSLIVNVTNSAVCARLSAVEFLETCQLQPLDRVVNQRYPDLNTYSDTPRCSIVPSCCRLRPCSRAP